MAVIFKASFTTAQETKLAGIEAGAEVNVNPDWNAVSGDARILNKPTLGTAAATNSTDYATAAQGTKADTAFGWGNHASAGYLLSATAVTTYQPLDGDLTSIAELTGTAGLLRKTAANSWSLDTTTYLTGNQSITVSGDASGTGTTAIALTLANTGVTASTYRSVTVDAKGRVTSGTNPTTLSGYGITDAQPLATVLTNTTASFTTAQETKLAGIAAGAEVNVNADWNAVSGDAQILNKPTLGTMSAQNASSVAVTGGTINGATIGGTTAAAGSFSTLSASGGLKFPATQSALSDANTLDDYEEGTWTPTLTAITNVSSMSSNNCRYTKIGNVVMCTGNITATSGGAGTFNFTMTGPFSMIAVSDVGNLGVVSVYPYAGTYKQTGYVIDNSGGEATSMYVEGYVSTSGSVTFRISLTYQTA